jgi:hypothetical protein
VRFSSRGSIGLDLQADDVDIWTFEALVGRARQLRAAGDTRWAALAKMARSQARSAIDPAAESARGLPSWASRSQVALASVLTLRGRQPDLERAAELCQIHPPTPGVEGFLGRERQRLGLS